MKFAWNFPFFTPFLTWNFGEIFRRTPKPWKKQHGKFDQNFTPDFTTPLAEKNGEKFHFRTSAGYLLWQIQPASDLKSQRSEITAMSGVMSSIFPLAIYCDLESLRLRFAIWASKFPVWNSLTLQPLLFWKEQGFFPQKSKGFSLRGTPKILGKGRKTHKKSKENRKTKKQGNRKKQGLEGQGFRTPQNSCIWMRQVLGSF